MNNNIRNLKNRTKRMEETQKDSWYEKRKAELEAKRQAWQDRLNALKNPEANPSAGEGVDA